MSRGLDAPDVLRLCDLIVEICLDLAINGKSSTEWTDPLVAKRTLALKQGPVGTAEEIRRLTFQSIKALLNVLHKAHLIFQGSNRPEQSRISK